VWALSVVAAAMLAVGYRTRTAAILAFVAVISFQQRNPLILDGSDLVFRAVPFWLIFTAAGDRYSVDAALRRARGEEVRPQGPALPVRILQLQIAWIYLATGIEKLAGTQWLGGTAAYYALQLKHTFGRPWAEALVRSDLFVRAVSWGTLVVELGFLPAAFFPFLQPFVRLVAVAAALGLHLGILVLMNVGNFPVVMMAGLILFLPPPWVERLVARLAAIPPARGASALVARLAAAAPRPSTHRASWSAAAAGALLLVALASFGTAMPRPLGPSTGEPLSGALRFAALDQRWDMFSPDPARADGWISARGQLADGTAVELIGEGGRPVPRDPIVLSGDEPIAPRYADPLYTRWTKVHERIPNVAFAEYRLEYGRMFCRLRNLHLAPGGSPLVRFDVVYVERIIQPDLSPPDLVEHRIWSHEC
ncbi:MAG TPA: HTTM domain-containing protein, partial [Planctomycetaceae bacterium]|nr:HTTM domain-containing protein [Planctomycetaceae bacterium]